MTETEVTIETEEGVVYGALFVPDGAKCAALIIGGSGPHDRNGQSTNLHAGYDEWASALAAHGIATLRLDKPGVAPSPMPTTRPVRYSHDVARNIRAIDLLANTLPDLPITFIGHSLGALTALELPQDRISGIAYVAGPGRTLDRVICDQVRRHLETHGADQETINEHLAERLNVYQTFARGQVLKTLPSWAGEDVESLIYLGDTFQRDPLNLLAECPTPVYLVRAELDENIFDADWRFCQAARPDAPALLMHGADHCLKTKAGALNTQAMSWIAQKLLEGCKA